MNPMRLEPTKLILIGTRTTYQATGDAGFACDVYTCLDVTILHLSVFFLATSCLWYPAE